MKYFLNILFLIFSATGYCQVLINNGSFINISAGTIIKVGSVENLNGTMTNNGILTIKSTYNNTADFNGSGDYNVAGNWINSGTFTPGTGMVTLDGDAGQVINSNGPFNNLSIDKNAGTTILSSDITINGLLNFISGKIQTGSNKVTISSTGTIIGDGQNTGWVYGNLKKYIGSGSAVATFAIGGNTYYTPVVIAFSNVTTAGSITASTTSGDHSNLNTSGIDVNKSVNRYFTITNNSIVFTDASVNLNWVASDIDAGASTGSFIAAKYNGTSWTYPAIASPNATSIQVTGLNSFGDFAVGEMFSALPVKLTNLRGYTKNYGIQVEWNTQTEINMDRFEIEKSDNGQYFTKAGSVNAKGNSSIDVSYGWFDASPIGNTNYYRIRAVEKTGLISYSQVVKINISTGRSAIIFNPNTVIGNSINLQLNNIPKGNYTISFTNTLGQQVFKKLILHNGGSAMQTIPVTNLTKSIYFLHVAGGGIKFTKQVFKN